VQLAWLLRPDGRDIDRVIDDLHLSRDVHVFDMIWKYAPRTLDGRGITGAETLRIMDGITGDVFTPKPCAPESGAQDPRTAYRADADRVFPLYLKTGQAIEMAEKTAKRRLRTTSARS
jgi:hypothetical protein